MLIELSLRVEVSVSIKLIKVDYNTSKNTK